MRLGVFAFLAALCVAASAAAQTSITLDANPAALIDAEINGRAVRLEVDPRMPDMLAISTPAAERLGLRRLPLARALVGIEGGASMRGRIARPRITLGERAVRNLAGIFPAPVSTRADGVIGPGSLPYDVVTLRLSGEAGATREIMFALANADIWSTRSTVGGVEVRLLFDLANEATILNRPLSRQLDRDGKIRASGDLAERAIILGLSTLMQPVNTDLSASGLLLGPTFARTTAPLLGALEADAFVIEAEGSETPPTLTLGRQALLAAGCVSISVNRRTRQLTLRCA
jgi:hypothetical protein